MRDSLIKLMPWMGGKGQLMWAIQMLLPIHYKTLVDVFGGSGIITLNTAVPKGCLQIYMRDVIPSIYQATRPRFATAEEQLRKLLDPLDGMELTSAGHLTAQDFSFSDELLIENGKLNFYVQADFDVDAAFGTFVCTDENDDWLNIYANYDIVRDRPCDTLELNFCKGDGTEEYWSYHLNAAEQEVLARKMEAFCQQQNGMSLHDFARQLQEKPRPSPQMQL